MANDGTRTMVELDAGGGARVPGILHLPAGPPPFPAVLLLHGFTSRKEDMAGSIGRALAERGVGSLAIDLPLHGARSESDASLSMRNPMALVQAWRLAVREAETAIDYLATNPAIDAARIGIAGYSLGSYLAVTVAASLPTIRAVALTAGGDLPANTPFASIVRAIADPRRAVEKIAGRPLLLMNGRRDRTIRPDQARALFDAASEPKELRWYDGAHWPPAAVMRDVADWLVLHLRRNPAAGDHAAA